jgi:hypothetical protein
MLSVSGCLDIKPTSFSRAIAFLYGNHQLRHTASSTHTYPPVTSFSEPDLNCGCALMEQSLLVHGSSNAYEIFSRNQLPVNLCVQEEQLH